jgi:deoxyxylulose-5-phosphate synthase
VASAVVTAGLGKKVVPVALPDEFLDAGALPTLHERYGLSVQRIVAKVLAELGSRRTVTRPTAEARTVHETVPRFCRNINS